jgi:hypothetical protein
MKYSEKNPPMCNYKSHTIWPGIESSLPWWYAVYVMQYKLTNSLEECTAFIFRVEELAGQETAN